MHLLEKESANVLSRDICVHLASCMQNLTVTIAATLADTDRPLLLLTQAADAMELSLCRLALLLSMYLFPLVSTLVVEIAGDQEVTSSAASEQDTATGVCVCVCVCVCPI